MRVDDVRVDSVNGRRKVAAVVSLALVGALVGAPANATYPGANGMIALVNGGIQTVDDGGTGLTTIVPAGAGFTHRDPSWSPTGSRVAYSRLDGGDWDVFVVHADGSDVVRLADLYQEHAEQPGWTPDGAQIVYRCSGQALGYGGGDICRISLDGTGRVNLTSTNNDDEYYPAYSPDGSKLAVSKSFQFSGHSNGPGGGRLTDTAVDNTHPLWSPDGLKIAFERAGDIWVMNADGSMETPLTGAGAIESDPSWSPGGSRITYVREGAVWIMDGDGTDQAVIPGLPAGAYPDWGPVIDTDSDQVPDDGDNCPTMANPSQADNDLDGQGDACDSDDDNDGAADAEDACPLSAGSGPDGCTPSSLKVTVHLRVHKVRIAGALLPRHPGRTVAVTLSRLRRGRYVTVAGRSPTLNSRSRYRASFVRPSARWCRVIVKFGRDADHSAAIARRVFRC